MEEYCEFLRKTKCVESELKRIFEEIPTMKENLFIQGESLTGTYILTVDSRGQRNHFIPLSFFLFDPVENIQAVEIS